MKHVLPFLFFFILLETKAQTGLTSFKVYKGFGASYPSLFTEFKGKLYFFANDSAHGYELWCVDTTTGLKMVADLNPGKKDGVAYKVASQINYHHLAIANDASNNQYLFFPGYSAGDSFELFKYDGVTTPTKAFSFHPGPGAIYATSMVGIGSKVFFGNDHLNGALDSLWMYNVATNTKKFIYYPVTTGNVLVNYHNRLYFYDGVQPTTRVFCYDPTMDTLGLVKDYGSGWVNSFKVAGNKLYMSVGKGLYVYDDMAASDPQQVPGTDAAIGQESYKDRWDIEEFNGKIYYPVAASSSSGIKGLGEYDPSTGHVNKYITAAEASCFTVYGGKLYFQAGGGQSYYQTNKDTVHGAELWEFDGANPPKMAVDIWPGMISATVALSSDPFYLTGFNDGVYFTAVSATTGRDLFKYVPSNNSVQNVSFTGHVKVYPNPSTSSATLELNLAEAMNLRLALRNIEGKEVLRPTQSNFPTGKSSITLNLQDLTAGVYFYILSDEGGRILYSEKIVKE
jgi:ELWxxDGT repeat protein